MLMICWFYCLSFAKVLYYASAPLLFVFSLFVLKRGIFRARAGLRETAFAIMLCAAVKVFVFDVRTLDQYVVCATGIRAVEALCSPIGFKVIGVLGLLGLCGCAYAIFYFYRATLRNKPPRLQSPEAIGIRHWANASMTGVIVLMCWTLVPWIGSLTVGSVPDIFIGRAWQYIALVCVGMLLTGFWRAESCDWVGGKNAAGQRAGGIRPGSYASAVWTPRDTLWMAVFLFLGTIALSYVGHDVLTK